MLTIINLDQLRYPYDYAIYIIRIYADLYQRLNSLVYEVLIFL